MGRRHSRLYKVRANCLGCKRHLKLTQLNTDGVCRSCLAGGRGQEVMKAQDETVRPKSSTLSVNKEQNESEKR